MAKQKKPKPTPTKKSATGESFIVLDAKRLPVASGAYGNLSPEVKYVYEFRLIDGMRVGQSAIFPKAKLNVINAIRTRIHKIGSKRFIVRKVDLTQNRIWRVADNAVLQKGGRVKGVSPYKKSGDETQE